MNSYQNISREDYKKVQRLDCLAKTMKAKHLLIAIGLSEGETQEQAYLGAGYKSKDPRSNANNIIQTNPSISEYSELAKEIAKIDQGNVVGIEEWKRDKEPVVREKKPKGWAESTELLTNKLFN